jgi:hypothetical protein
MQRRKFVLTTVAASIAALHTNKALAADIVAGGGDIAAPPRPLDPIIPGLNDPALPAGTISPARIRLEGQAEIPTDIAAVSPGIIDPIAGTQSAGSLAVAQVVPRDGFIAVQQLAQAGLVSLRAGAAALVPANYSVSLHHLVQWITNFLTIQGKLGYELAVNWNPTVGRQNHFFAAQILAASALTARPGPVQEYVVGQQGAKLDLISRSFNVEEIFTTFDTARKANTAAAWLSFGGVILARAAAGYCSTHLSEFCAVTLRGRYNPFFGGVFTENSAKVVGWGFAMGLIAIVGGLFITPLKKYIESQISGQIQSGWGYGPQLWVESAAIPNEEVHRRIKWMLETGVNNTSITVNTTARDELGQVIPVGELRTNVTLFAMQRRYTANILLRGTFVPAGTAQNGTKLYTEQILITATSYWQRVVNGTVSSFKYESYRNTYMFSRQTLAKLFGDHVFRLPKPGTPL